LKRVDRDRPVLHFRLFADLAQLAERSLRVARPADAIRRVEQRIHQAAVVRARNQPDLLSAPVDALHEQRLRRRRRREIQFLEQRRRRSATARESGYDRVATRGRVARNNLGRHRALFPQRLREPVEAVAHRRGRRRVGDERDPRLRERARDTEEKNQPRSPERRATKTWGRVHGVTRTACADRAPMKAETENAPAAAQRRARNAQ